MSVASELSDDVAKGSTSILFEKLRELADAKGGTDKLRELILELAVQGKLVPQDPDDEPADLLLARCKAERENLVKTKQTTKRKINSLDEAEHLFVVPECWSWTCLAAVTRDFGQKRPSSEFTYIDVSSIDNKRSRLNDNALTVQPEDAPSRARKLVRVGTVLYSTVRPYLLNIAEIEVEITPTPIASTAFGVLHPLGGIESRFWSFTSEVHRSPHMSKDCKQALLIPRLTMGNCSGAQSPFHPLPSRSGLWPRWTN